MSRIFEENLKRFRTELHLSQPELAEKIGVSFTTYRRWESGLTSPRAPEIKRICEVFNISESELLNSPKKDEFRINILMEVEDMMNEMAIKKDEFNVGFRSDGQFIFWGALPQDMSIDAILDKFRVELTLAHEMKDLRDKKLKDN